LSYYVSFGLDRNTKHVRDLKQKVENSRSFS
jgi:hypothetical protein